MAYRTLNNLNNKNIDKNNSLKNNITQEKNTVFKTNTNLKSDKLATDLYKEDSNLDTSTNPYDDALAKAKRDQNYKSFYNTAIQLYNMKNNANKYLSNQLASQGLNTQGYGSSAQIGVNNQAANLYAENLQNYNNNEQEITNDAISRNESNQAEQDNQLVTFIQNSIANGGGTEQINKFLQNYGYMDESGNYTDKWNSLDDSRKAYIQSVIDGADTTTEPEGTISSNIKYNDMSLEKWLAYNELKAYDWNSLKTSKWGSGEGANNALDSSSGVANELNKLEEGINADRFKSGDVFKLGHGNNEWTVNVLYYNGKFYRVDDNFYNTYTGNKYNIYDSNKIVKQ